MDTVCPNCDGELQTKPMSDYIFINSKGHELATQTFETEAQARAHAEHLAIENRTAVTVAEVVTYRVRPTCCLCPDSNPHPATILAGDLEVCDDCHAALAAPWPDVDELPEMDGTEGLGESSY